MVSRQPRRLIVPGPCLIVVALRGSLCLLKTAVMANRAALHDGPRRHIANPITNKGPEADAGRNGIVAHSRIGVVPAITALWVGLVCSPLQRVVAHIFVFPDFCPGSCQLLYTTQCGLFAGWPGFDKRSKGHEFRQRVPASQSPRCGSAHSKICRSPATP